MVLKSLLVFVAFFSVYKAFPQALVDRQAEHEEAKHEFYSTHFFENGRGMTISPDLSIFFGGLENDDSIYMIDRLIAKRYGFNEGEDQRYMGVFEIEWEGLDIAVLGCTGCHSGRAAGVTIPGLGNKTIDPFLIGKDLLKVQKNWQWFINDKIEEDKNYAYVHEKAMNFASVLADEEISNLTRGLVPDSTIKTFFYKDMGVEWGPEIERTQVKVPSLWGFAKKREVGVFADGSLNSANYAWAFGAEMFASDSGEHLRASLPKLVNLIDNVVGKLLPPKYPFEVNESLAANGKLLVEKNCYACHGEHKRDPEGFPIYEAPKLIPHNRVDTDSQRLEYGSQLWVDLAEESSLGDVMKFNRDLFGFGYYAPKLWGIWSRFPYLHNGSVPTLYHMLMPPSERPVVFSMDDAGEAYRFDSEYGGLTGFYNPAMIKIQTRKAKEGDRNLYYVKRPEHSNKGHYFFFMHEWSREDRLSVVEYLKTL